jgi:hypothetical protein
MDWSPPTAKKPDRQLSLELPLVELDVLDDLRQESKAAKKCVASRQVRCNNATRVTFARKVI